MPVVSVPALMASVISLTMSASGSGAMPRDGSPVTSFASGSAEGPRKDGVRPKRRTKSVKASVPYYNHVAPRNTTLKLYWTGPFPTIILPRLRYILGWKSKTCHQVPKWVEKRQRGRRDQVTEIIGLSVNDEQQQRNNEPRRFCCPKR